jgi:hypothetical protein
MTKSPQKRQLEARRTDSKNKGEAERAKIANRPSMQRIRSVMNNTPAPQPSYSQSRNRIDDPTPVDVLLGRGKPVQSHPGNQWMLRIVDEHRARYLQAERKDKHEIIEEIMRIIQECGGRFLTRVDYENYWIEVSHSIAYRKVGHAFRSKARTTRNPESRRTTASENPPTNASLSQSGLMVNQLPDGVAPDRARLERAISLGPTSSTASQLMIVNNQIPVFSRIPLVPPVSSHPMIHEPAIGLQPELELLNRIGTRSIGRLLPPAVDPLLYHQHLLGVPSFMGGITVPNGVASFENILAAHSQMIDSLSSQRRPVGEVLHGVHAVAGRQHPD